jgi:NADP-dependent 3-hydroxy acid dehydrogenase YdfG
MTRVVAITGASAGIGRATAIRLARTGAALALCARRADRLRAVADEIQRAGGTAITVAADVTNPTDMGSLVERATDTWGRLDAIVCNAGLGIYGQIDRVTPEQMRLVMDVNYMGTFHAARAAFPVFKRQGHGHFIVVSSIVGKRGVPYMGAYAATKFAQVGLAECLRAELVGTGIHLSVVYPVSTETEFFDVMTTHSGPITRALGPRQSPDDVGHAILKALEHPVPEVYPYRMARALAILAAVAPGLCDKVVRRWGRRPVEAGIG